MEDLEKQIRSFDEEKNRARIMEHHQQMGSYESGPCLRGGLQLDKAKKYL